VKAQSSLSNYTFTLPQEMMEKLKDFVKRDNFPSINSFVREALKSYLDKIEKEHLRKEMKKASKDPMFIKDMDNSMGFFKRLDDESYVSEKIDSEW
jgi:Arc/MetJ-type ribon-helix-helix transcriptional regulator